MTEAPTNSQQIAWRAFGVGSAAFGRSRSGATAMLKPSLPSTACLFNADEERTNQAPEELNEVDFPD